MVTFDLDISRTKVYERK